ncbi:MAG: biotin/lipoyl-containing protein [bacterium]
MAFITKIDNKEFKVDLKQEGKGFKVYLDGKPREVTVANDKGSRLTLIIDDKPFDIIWEADDHIVVGGESYNVEIFDEQVERLMKASPGKSGKRALTMKAAMPGLIIEVTVKQGDKVTEGQGLLIIEAMKMQNEMQTPRDGVVKTVKVQKGQTVNSGETLIIIE